MIKKNKNTILRTYATEAFHGEDSFGTTYKANCKKTNETELRVEKSIKNQGDTF